MNNIIQGVRQLQKQPVAKEVKERLFEFEELGKKAKSGGFPNYAFAFLPQTARRKRLLGFRKSLDQKGFVRQVRLR